MRAAHIYGEMRIIMLRTDGGGSAEISCIHDVMSTFAASFTVARHDVDKITICQALLIKQAVINFTSKSQLSI